MSFELSADKIITETQATKILNAAKFAANESIRNGSFTRAVNAYYIFAIAYNTGLRVSELMDLKWKDIHDDFLIVRNGKGSKKRSVIFGNETAQLFAEFKTVQLKLTDRKCEQSDSLFIGQRGSLTRVAAHQVMKAILKEKKLSKNLSMHSWRHGYATRLLDAGITLQTVRDQLGHSNISVTSLYLHFTEENKLKLKKIL